MNKIIIKQSLKVTPFFLLAFLSFFDFMGRGPVVFLPFCIYGLFITRNVRWIPTCDLYLLVTVFATITSFIYYDYGDAIKAVLYFLSFYIGYRFYCSYKSAPQLLFYLIFWSALGCAAYLFYTAYLNVWILGHEEGGRSMISPWTLEPTPATIFGLLSCVPIVYSFYCFFLSKKVVFFLVGATFLLGSLWVNIETATRTPFVIFAIVYAIMFYELLRKGNIKSLPGLFVILFVAIVLFNSDLWSDLLFVLSNSDLSYRFKNQGLESLRWDYAKLYFDNMIEYPWGGGFVEKKYQIMAHNLIQEGYDYYGVFFTIPLLIIIVGMLIRIIKLHLIKYKTSFTFLFLSLYIGVMIQVLMEPVIVGYPQLIWLLFLIDGIVVGAFVDNRNDLLQRNKIAVR